MEFVALDPAVAAGLSGNGPVLAVLETFASPQSPDKSPPWVVGGFTVPTHPDLVLRLDAVGQAAALDLRFVYGVPSLVDAGGAIVAFANGTESLSIRATGNEADEMREQGGHERPDLPGWLRVGAWLAAAARADGVALTARWCRSAVRDGDRAARDGDNA